MKHDHKKTKKLKVALFAMFMFLPFIAIGITCLTHVFNEKVAEETETATINYMYETEQTPVNDNLKNNYIYQFPNTYSQYTQIYCKYLQIYSNNENKIFQEFLVTHGYMCIDYDNDILIIDNSLTTIYVDISDFNTQAYKIFFVYDSQASIQYNGQDTPQNSITPMLQVSTEYIPIESVSIETTPQDQTTNIFYDSCDQVKQSFILNWCNEENPINSGLANFTQVFNIPNDNIINTLLTYMLSISMIYIVIDIIIETIIYISHFFNKEF